MLPSEPVGVLKTGQSMEIGPVVKAGYLMYWQGYQSLWMFEPVYFSFGGDI
jgi:hypothetical protein